MLCKDCQLEKLQGTISGQGFTSWICQECGQQFIHHNTNVPKVCKNCSDKLHICEQCAKLIK